MVNRYDINREGVLKYLKSKYDEDFEITCYVGESFGTGGDRWGVKPLGATDEQMFTVFGNEVDSGYEYSDSYYSVYIREQYERLVTEIIGECQCEIQRDSPNAASLKKGVEVSEIWKHIKESDYAFVPRITIFDKENNTSLEQIAHKLAEQKLSAWIELYTEDYETVQKREQIYIDKSFQVITKPICKSCEAEYMTIERLAKLCTIVYLNGIIRRRHFGNLGDILEYIKSTEYADSVANNGYPCEMTRAQWDTVIDTTISDSFLSGLKIIKHINVNERNAHKHPDILPGHRAVCFADCAGNAYAIFRGTSGDHEWYDNAAGMVLESTKQQHAAEQFVRELRESKEFSINELTVAGHSKGGNKAQYALFTTPEGYVNRCVSFDGQGFSKAFIKKYESQINERKLKLIAEQRDFVNSLGFYAGDTAFYRGWRGKTQPDLPYGYSVTYFHCPDALGDENGFLGEAYKSGSIPKAVNSFVTFALDGSKILKNPYDTAVDLVSLMMKNKRATDDEAAEAIKNIILVFMELIATEKQFRKDIAEVIYSETSVIIATIEDMWMLKPDEKGSNPLMSKLAKALLSNPKNMKNFFTCLGVAASFAKNIIASKEKAHLFRLFFDFANSLERSL